MGDQLDLWAPRAFAVPATGLATLANAQAGLLRRLDEGERVDCPCCGKPAKLYHRRLNATMARGLIWLVRESLGAVGLGDADTLERQWVDVPEVAPAWLMRSKQLTTLRLWRLVEAGGDDGVDDGSARRRGLWRPTALGVRFVLGRVRVPASVEEYRSEVRRYDEEVVDIRGALGTKFDWYELMGWTP